MTSTTTVTIRVQDEFKVNTVLPTSIDYKFKKIEELFDEAGKDATPKKLFVNFTSGASTGAYPNAVAGRINYRVIEAIKKRANDDSRKRLGIVVTDFPDDNGRTKLVDVIIQDNKSFPKGDWSRDWWLAQLGNNMLISDLSIPGTHDTAAFNASPISKTQNLNILQQLKAGVRFLDIRCRHYEDKFYLHHGREFLGMEFDTAVLAVCKSYLQAFPTECIILSVKSEHTDTDNTSSFQECFARYQQASEAAGLQWYLGCDIPKLGDVRGKVVLFRRFEACPRAGNGIDASNWLDDKTFTITY